MNDIYKKDCMKIPVPEAIRYAFSDVISHKEMLLTKVQLKDVSLWKLLVSQFAATTDSFGVDIADRGWRCEYWGKLMRGAVFTYRSCRDEELYSVIEETVRDLIETSDALGRITTYTVEKEFDGWDMWGRKYVMLGFLYFLDICRDEKLSEKVLSVLCKHADYIISRIGDGDGKIPIGITSTHWDGMNSCSILEPFVLLYNKTGEERYLEFADYIVSVGGQHKTNIFEIACENKTAIKDYPQPKAYEMMSCFDGLAEYIRIRPSEKYKTALINFTKRIIDEEVSVIGCLGCDFESFDGSRRTQFAPELETRVMQETCVTVTWMKLCLQMLRMTGDLAYADEMEKSAYNAFLGAILNEDEFDISANGGIVLPVDSYSPLRKDKRGKKIGGRKTINSNGAQYGCCVAIAAAGFGVMSFGSVMEIVGGYAVNFFRNGTVEINDKRGHTVFEFDTNYPASAAVVLKITSDAEDPFNVSMRIPDYSKMAILRVNEQFMMVEGRRVDFTVKGNAEVLFMPDTPVVKVTPKSICPDTDVDDVFCVVDGCIVLAADAHFTDPEEGLDLVYDLKIGGFDQVDHEGEIPGVMKALDFRKTDGSDVTLIDYASAGHGKEKTLMAAWIRKQD